MSIATLTSGDRRIRDAVLLQLEWDAELDASAIGVSARNNVVTLTGFVDTCAAKLAAERAARRVHGVKAVANDIQLRMRLPRTDDELAADTVRALELRGVADGVQIVVHNGHVTLTGVVPTPFDRAYARKALRLVPGVKGIVNRIKVTPTAPANGVRRDIDHALDHDASIPRPGIEVTVADGTVTLTGQVGSWLEREAAARIAARARGITKVTNHITVASPHDDGTPAPEDECT